MRRQPNEQRPALMHVKLISRKLLPLLLFIGIAPNAAYGQIWTVLAGDAKGDARDPSMPDAAQLAYRYDKQGDFLWFRVTLYGTVNEQAFGVNIVVDTGADESAKMKWRGANTGFKFDKLLTAWVTKRPNGYQATIG